MNTNELIDSLAQDLAPVHPLPRPGRRAAVWLFGSILYLALLTLLFSNFGTFIGGLDRNFLQTQLIGVVAGILAAGAAFASVVPGYSRPLYLWTAIATLGWLAVFIVSAFGANAEQSVLAASHEWVCVGVILVGGAPMVATLAVMLRRGAPLNPVRTALLGALAVGLLADVAACISRPHPENLVTLAWHGGALIALALVCIAGSRFVLNWKSQLDIARQ